MQLLHACDLLFLGMQLCSFMRCDSFSNSGGTAPTRFTLRLCLSSSVGGTKYLLLPGLFFWAECCLVMLPTFELFHILTVDWIAYGQMNGSNYSGSCESIAYPLSWERCCGSSPRDSPIHSMGFLSRILLQGELLAKQKEIIIQLELGDRMLENKRLVYKEPYDYIPLPSSNFRSTPYLIERRL